MNDEKGSKFSRRSFLKGLGSSAIGTAAISTGLVKTDPAEAYTPETSGSARAKKALNLKVNGKHYKVDVEHRNTLAEVLRDQVGLTGTKIGCDRGECGACTVIIDGRNMYSCSQLAVWMEGKEILTIEGLAKDGELNAVQEAFVKNYAFQCGYCTPGMVMTSQALLQRNPNPTEEEIRKALAGNLCMCTGYVQIVDAVKEAAKGIKNG